MTILVTGATGQFGGLAVRHLLDRVPAAELAVSVRDASKAADLAERGVEVREGDFDAPETLRFDGVDTLLLVSANGPDAIRLIGQNAAVDAAVRAGVGRIVYTSVTDATTSPLELAKVHAGTEERIKASGVPYTFLRNGMYHENYLGGLPQALERGTLVTATGEGRVASASRDDLALAAAIVVTTEGHDGAAYELTGTAAWSFDELAALAADLTGKPLAHVSVPGPELAANLAAVGLPGFLAELLADIQVNISRGALSEVRPDLGKLIGREPKSIADAVRSAL
ncbi:SDR family oxidoreductase [Actinokineospora globicatena]|uniref:SDR family oxidoreductase n=1 Tax=Actinokineospora globicatena TaxID=103729 RepID=UPI0020A3BBBF|nr:SDR family oxidoreductase [Actinokineospora globicatena]MCP2300723.1 NAD(P)H dehydrogenase (quinone) [Actinokineospora globicatena]GLW77652.1 NAD(P)-dependent oxidoreductase [Actinokineospora globicatena]GLW84488.1 NAD(P)-dependent oxidoreductase [Actinokineospora globicatena]